jgi:hypothetical protein
MKTLLRSSRRLTSGPENALALKRQISYSLVSTTLLRWRVESAIEFNPGIEDLVNSKMIPSIHVTKMEHYVNFPSNFNFQMKRLTTET